MFFRKTFSDVFLKLRFWKTFSDILLILLIDYHMILWICLIRLGKDFFRLDYINKLVNMSQSDHMTESNDSDHINKLVDMSWSDHMIVQNENSVNEKCCLWTIWIDIWIDSVYKHLSNKSHIQLSQSLNSIILTIDWFHLIFSWNQIMYQLMKSISVIISQYSSSII